MDSDSSPRRVSLRDIAKMMGVSHVTISLALRDSPQISTKLKDEVKQMAAALGYRPDPMLKALSSYRQSKSTPQVQAAIAWINAWPEPEKLRSYREFDLYWKGASEAATKFGYRLEEFRMNAEFTPRRLHQIFQTRGISGILIPPHGTTPDWADFPWENYAVARFGRTMGNPNAHVVTADQLTNTIVAYQAMRDRGYRRVGFVTKDIEVNSRGHLFASGFVSFQQMVDECDRVPLFKFSDHTERNRTAAFKEWLKTEKPDAILTAAEDIQKLLSKAGLSVPKDIPLAVLSLADGGADSGIDQHPEEIGRVGFLLLNSLINDGARGIPNIFRQILVEGSWVDGKSLPIRKRVK